MTIIFKICDRSEWEDAVAAGTYRGSAHDQRDGFIHFSTGAQLPVTLAKHYAGREGLLLVALDAEALGPALRWEPARDGDRFPHLYASLPTSAALWTKPLPLDANGTHVLPAEAAS